MELLLCILYIVGFYGSIYIIAWLIRTISKFLEIRKYKAKLKKITPQLKTISTEELSSELLSIKESYLPLVDLLRQRYRIGGEDEQVKDIYKYAEEEADYRRSMRKPPERTRRRKYKRYRRYY
jgi:hypothetical protein